MRMNTLLRKTHLLEDQPENVYNRIDTGECHKPKTFGREKKLCSVSEMKRSNLTILPKPSDFEREMNPMPGTFKSENEA